MPQLDKTTNKIIFDKHDKNDMFAEESLKTRFRQPKVKATKHVDMEIINKIIFDKHDKNDSPILVHNAQKRAQKNKLSPAQATSNKPYSSSPYTEPTQQNVILVQTAKNNNKAIDTNLNTPAITYKNLLLCKTESLEANSLNHHLQNNTRCRSNNTCPLLPISEITIAANNTPSTNATANNNIKKPTTQSNEVSLPDNTQAHFMDNIQHINSVESHNNCDNHNQHIDSHRIGITNAATLLTQKTAGGMVVIATIIAMAIITAITRKKKNKQHSKQPNNPIMQVQDCTPIFDPQQNKTHISNHSQI